MDSADRDVFAAGLCHNQFSGAVCHGGTAAGDDAVGDGRFGSVLFSEQTGISAGFETVQQRQFIRRIFFPGMLGKIPCLSG